MTGLFVANLIGVLLAGALLGVAVWVVDIGFWHGWFRVLRSASE